LGHLSIDRRDQEQESPNAGVCSHAALPGQIHITRLTHGPQPGVSRSVGETTRWPPTEQCQYPVKTVMLNFRVWPFPRATKLQLPGHFWPEGNRLHTPALIDCVQEWDIPGIARMLSSLKWIETYLAEQRQKRCPAEFAKYRKCEMCNCKTSIANSSDNRACTETGS